MYYSQSPNPELLPAPQHPIFIAIFERVGVDEQRGRTAWSSTVTVASPSSHPNSRQKLSARYWYDGQYVHNAKEDAAEVALRTLTNAGSPAGGGGSSSGTSGSGSYGGLSGATSPSATYPTASAGWGAPIGRGGVGQTQGQAGAWPRSPPAGSWGRVER
ncbi:hypothetical protein MMC34_005916 [Xylographa carneopallida]|nr:hypothetical protein [Xylographa carneopallida]